MGACAYRFIENVAFKPGECAVEIGSDRGEGSTRWLSDWCTMRGVPFHSVDIDPSPAAKSMCVHEADGTEWLLNFTGTIKFAYLDNYDYVWPEIAEARFVKNQIERYAERGITMTNEGSELAHLTQAICVHNRAPKNAVIVIDDTWIPSFVYHGKGALAVPWLLFMCWDVVNIGDGPGSAVVLRKRP